MNLILELISISKRIILLALAGFILLSPSAYAKDVKIMVSFQEGNEMPGLYLYGEDAELFTPKEWMKWEAIKKLEPSGSAPIGATRPEAGATIRKMVRDGWHIVLISPVNRGVFIVFEKE